MYVISNSFMDIVLFSNWYDIMKWCFVNSISTIEILTTTRELLFGEPPEVCHIQAFDTEGRNKPKAKPKQTQLFFQTISWTQNI